MGIGEGGRESVRAVAAGRDSSYGVTTTGKVYSWGGNRQGCLGHGEVYGGGKGGMQDAREGEKFTPVEPSPRVVEWFLDRGVRVARIAAGASHFVAMTSAGEVYTCGEGAFGRLGVGNTENAWEPVHVTTFPKRKYPERVVGVAAGGDVTFVLRECAVLGVMVYLFGRIGSEFEGYYSPEIFPELCGREVCGVCAGKTHQIAWTRSGELFGWGKNSKCPTNGMIGEILHKVSHPHSFSLLHNYQVIAAGCGAHYTLIAVEQSDKVSREIVVPLTNRYFQRNLNFIPLSKVPFEKAAAEYRIFMLGEKEGLAYNETLPHPQEEMERNEGYEKKGAHALSVGSKVRVWVQDIEALGTIIRLPGQEQANPHEYEIHWLREDWVDEVVTLPSDDETGDVANTNRWLHGWT